MENQIAEVLKAFHAAQVKQSASPTVVSCDQSNIQHK